MSGRGAPAYEPGSVGQVAAYSPSELDDRPAENPSLLQCDPSLVDLVQGISVGHELLQREPALTHPFQEEREVGIGVRGAEAPAVVALVQQNCVQVDRD